MTEHTAHEYGGRFLIELLQNAYDAHPRERQDGRVAVVFDETEGVHGTVYLANGGRPFNWSNVRSICNLGLSDKPVGDGIGNKGVGFKSVLQVCAEPEIYSADEDDTSHDGFCFRFARPEDVLELVDGDSEKAWIVEAEVSLYTLPIPLRLSPPRVKQLRADGYVTVVRLPLRSEIARDVARERLHSLIASDVPILLFLRRLSQLTITHHTSDCTDVTDLGRAARQLTDAGGGYFADNVDLGPGGRYLVFSVDVEPNRLHDAIDAAIDAERADIRWREWSAPARVSLAVPVDHTLNSFRSYTYLPMGTKARAPFAGHLNAPFFTNLSRLDLDASHPLNAMLLDIAAELALKAAFGLQAVNDRYVTAAAVDLLSWTTDAIGHLRQAAQRLYGQDFLDLAVLPTEGKEVGRICWNPPSVVFRWPLTDARTLSARRAAATTDGRLLDLGLGMARLDRLYATLAALGHSLDPPPELLANWVETICTTLPRAPASLGEWDGVYDELCRIFATCPAALAGRKVLLTDSFDLRSCDRRSDDARASQRGAFFPPVRQRTDDEDEIDKDIDVRVPKSLQRHIFYVHPDLSWYDSNRQTTASLRFLRVNNLVARFDTRSLLEHVRSVLRDTSSKRIHEDALRFVFNLQRAKTPTQAQLRALGLRVPNGAGRWLPANRALFSRKWTATLGADLAFLAATPSEVSQELSDLTARLIADPDVIVRQGKTVDEWTDFLRHIGVSDTLPLLAPSDSRGITGRNLTPAVIGNVSGLPSEARQQWIQTIDRSGFEARYPDTPYVATSRIYRAAGQADHPRLTARAKAAYARLLLHGLQRWSDECLETEWHRDRYGDRDPQVVHTPLAAFIKAAQWFPVHEPKVRQDVYRRPAESWYYSFREGEAPPLFTPLVATRAGQFLEEHPRALDRLRTAGLNVWNDPKHAGRLIPYLADLLAQDEVEPLYFPLFERTYANAWVSVAELQISILPVVDSWRVVVNVGGRPRSLLASDVRAQSESFRVHLADEEDDRVRLRLLRELERPLLVVPRLARSVAALLSEPLGGRVVLVRNLHSGVLVDREPYKADGEAEPLVSQVPWLAVLIAAVLEFRPGRYRLGERGFQDALDRLQRIRLRQASRVQVEIAGATLDIPARLHGVLAVPDDALPTLLAQDHPGAIEWPLLEALAEPLVGLLSYPDLNAQLGLAFMRLRAAGVPAGTGPTHDELSDALDVSVDDIHQTARRVQGAIAPLLYRIYPVIVHSSSLTVAAPFVPYVGEYTSEDQVLVGLEVVAEHLPVQPEQLIAVARDSASIDELRRALSIDLESFNHTLRTLGSSYASIDYEPEHAEKFREYVYAHRKALQNRLRWSRLTDFSAYRPQPDWSRLRDLSFLSPDQVWNTTRDELDDEVIVDRIESQLHEALGLPAITHGPDMLEMGESSRRNTELLLRHGPQMVAILRAWATRHGATIDSIWLDPDTAVERLRGALDDAGALDFRALAESDLVAWFVGLGLWPTNMPLSLDPGFLELSDKDIDQQRTEEETRRLERQRARRVLRVDGVETDVESGLLHLRDLLEESISRSPAFLETSRRFTRLQPIQPSSRRKGGGSGGSSTGRPTDRQLSDPQKNGLGFAGEWLAYHWLKKRYPNDFDDECWVSTNRRFVLSGRRGNDDLGYDFLILRPKGDPYYFEVKATDGEPGEFQLGESEIYQAQANARNDRWRLLIIAHVLTVNRRLLLLRNPFSTQARGQFTIAEDGLRIRYRPQS